MKAIVAVCRDWAIGYKGQLIVRNRADMEHFVSNTIGGTVIMGRKTLESFPGGRPLKKRRNIVLTHATDFERTGIEVAHCIRDLLGLVAHDDPERLWVIGGASVYRELLPYCDEVIVTKHDCTRQADSFFPNLDLDSCWQQKSCQQGGLTEEGIPYLFVQYARL